MQISRFQTLSPSLRSGLLYGAISVSAASGALTLAINRDELFTVLEHRASRAKAFFEEKLNPLLQEYGKGMSSIFDRQSQWFEYLSDFWNSLENKLSPENFVLGYEEIMVKLSAWYETASALLSDVFKWLKEMDEGKFRSFIHFLSQIPSYAKNIYSVLSNFLDEYFNNKKNKFPDNFFGFIKSSWELFVDNSSIISTLADEELKEIITFMSEDPDNFVKNVENAQKKADKKWGNYDNKNQLLNDILPNEQKWMLLLKRVSNAFITCKNGTETQNDSCWREHASIDDLKEFRDLSNNEEFKQKLELMKKEKEKNQGSNGNAAENSPKEPKQ